MTEQPLILIADDEPEILSLYKTKLERAGYRVSTAVDGARAVEMVAVERPNLLLIDVKMPVMDGITVQKKLRENPATKDVHVVFLTAFSDPAVQEMDESFGEKNGALGVIKKGGDLNELVQQIRGYLQAA